jgi:branched-chain amino acid transport system ATP-binding protein
MDTAGGVRPHPAEKARKTLQKSMSHLLQVRNLSKFFGGLAAIHDVDFHVIRGEILGIIGPNGAGKTTLFNLLTGMYHPSRGQIFFQEEPITSYSPSQTTRRGIARTFQTTVLFGELSVLDNVSIGRRCRMRSGLWDALLKTKRLRSEVDESLDCTQEILSFVGLAGHQRDLARNISQEAQKRLSIAMALATGPQLLLLDEPTSGLITEETGELMNLFLRIVKRGITICLIEHKMRVVMNISDRVMVLNHGEKIAEGPPQEINRHRAVIEAYLGEEYAAHP